MHDRLMIIGAAGDLTSRYLLPALVRLHNDGLLPENLTIDAISQEEMSDDEYRRKLEGRSQRIRQGWMKVPGQRFSSRSPMTGRTRPRSRGGSWSRWSMHGARGWSRCGATPPGTRSSRRIGFP